MRKEASGVSPEIPTCSAGWCPLLKDEEAKFLDEARKDISRSQVEGLTLNRR